MERECSVHKIELLGIAQYSPHDIWKVVPVTCLIFQKSSRQLMPDLLIVIGISSVQLRW